MTVEQLINDANLRAVCVTEPEREIEGVYVGDLLSWVMGRARENDAWITIMSNVNILAVATLSDASCVILSEGVSLDDETCKTAIEKGINVLTTDLTSYAAATKLYSLGI